MDCAEEVSQLKRQLSGVPGVRDLSFDVMKAKMVVQYDPSRLNEQEIAKAVARTGMRCEPFRETTGEPPWWQAHGRALLTAASGLAALTGTILHASDPGDFLRSLVVHEHQGPLPLSSLICFILAIGLGMFYAAPKALHSIRTFTPDMNALVAVSVIGAVVLREWTEGATLAFLFSLAGMLESWSMTRARNAVSSLLQVAPAEAAVVHGDHEHRVPVSEVKVGDQVRIRPGERVPCDGTVQLGTSHVNQALITGESVPILKSPGSAVYAGTMNGDGMLEVAVSKQSTETLLARMLRMLEGAQHRRAPSEQFVERFTRIYTPVMFFLAALVATFPPLFRGANWSESAYQGMVILLISCPCALVISTPVTVVAALASAARQGVLIKGGAFLEEAAKLRAVAFDKTGVLTTGKPEVQQFRTLGEMAPDDALRRLVALEQRSEHPVGSAIVNYARSQGVAAAKITEFRAVRGRGAEGVVGEERFWAGSHRMLHEKGLERPEVCAAVEALEDCGHTAFLCGTPADVWAVVSLSDPIRPEARAAIETLRRLGVEHIVMLTGDNAPTAKAVGHELGLDEIRWEMLPEEKGEAIQKLRAKYRHVAMVGDGVNDAQALASATVGVALGRRSTDVALETADVVLMNDDLTSLGFLLRHARRAAAVIRQNVAIALGLKAVFLLMALGGLATLWMAIAADMGATLVVTFNGLRLLRATR
jgi:Cd2+/Zn2+-exporting ATPase